MTRLTSREVWQQIQDEGLLTKMQRQALQLFCWNDQPLTGSELDQKSGSRYMHQRISELTDAGVLRQAGLKVCSVTGRTVMAWEPSDAMPHPTLSVVGRTKRKQTVKQLHDEVEQLRATNTFLRAESERLKKLLADSVRKTVGLQGTNDQLRQRAQIDHRQRSLFDVI